MSSGDCKQGNLGWMNTRGKPCMSINSDYHICGPAPPPAPPPSPPSPPPPPSPSPPAPPTNFGAGECSASSKSQLWTLSTGVTPGDSAPTNVGINAQQYCWEIPACVENGDVGVDTAGGACKALPSGQCSADHKCDCNMAWRFHKNKTISNVMDNTCLQLEAKDPSNVAVTVGPCTGDQHQFFSTTQSTSGFIISQGDVCIDNSAQPYHCFQQTCSNHGACINGNSSYTCNCTPGFVGKDCSETYCSGQTCSNHGACINGNSSYTCNCTPGFIGKDCGSVNHCYQQTCSSNGACINGNKSYTCNCNAGYSGTDCEHDPCYQEVCSGHGECIVDPSVGTHSCKCRPGFIGNECKCFGGGCLPKGTPAGGKDLCCARGHGNLECPGPVHYKCGAVPTL